MATLKFFTLIIFALYFKSYLRVSLTLLRDEADLLYTQHCMGIQSDLAQGQEPASALTLYYIRQDSAMVRLKWAYFQWL